MAEDIRLIGKEVADGRSADSLSGIEWMRRGDVRRICGIGKDILDHWVATDKVEAHKLNPGKNGTVIFAADDIRRAILASPKYRPAVAV